jgi:squalene-hopene/tetraprenyl-beta-curcumene cyclase
VLWKHQQDDGGWSTRSFSEASNWGPNIRPETVAMLQAEPDAAHPASDVYMTAFAIILLRENNVPADDPRIQRGIAWLKSGQRVSGRWWMKSLYKDTLHFSTYMATAHALRALALCGEINDAKVPVR